MGARGFDPIAVFVDADVEARGADDHVRSLDGTAVGGLKEGFEDASDLAFAALEEPGVVRVAIDGEAIGEIVGPGNLIGAAPADEIAFDGITIGMAADGAAARMAGIVGRSGRVGRRGRRGRSRGRLLG